MALIRDDRRNRWVREFVGDYETIYDWDFDDYDTDDPIKYDDHERFYAETDRIVDALELDPRTRRAIVTSDVTTDCMVGVQILIRHRINVFAWLRSSDVTEKRDDDIAFLIEFARTVREDMDLDQSIRIHLFTSSKHWEVDP